MIKLEYISQPDVRQLTIGKFTFSKKGRFWTRKSKAGELEGWYDCSSEVNTLLDEILKIEEGRNENA